MNRLPLRSSELLATADLLRSTASRMHLELQQRHREWPALREDVSGASFRAGFAGLSQAQDPAVAAVRRIGETGQLLETIAELLVPWEDMFARALPLLELTGEYNPVVARILQQTAAFVQLLDHLAAREIAALGGEQAQLMEEGLADFSGLPAEAIHEYHLPQLPPELAELAKQHPDLRILEVGEGTFAAAIGDIDTADAVVTLAAGTGSADPTTWPTYVDRTRAISQATGAATVLWLGHPAPGNLVGAASRASAQQAGPKLRDFQTELASRHPDQRRVVVGYSYGSVVLGEAASSRGRGLAADAVVLVGSPGAGASRTRDLKLISADGGEVHAVTGSADPIGLTATGLGGIHGVDPTTRLFGAQVWESASDHSGYWEDQEFLRQLKEVVSGPR